MKNKLKIILIIIALVAFVLFMMVTAYHQSEGVRSEKYYHR